MTIIDTFLFAGESDMAELRMRTLAPVADLFVAVACTATHQGVPLTDEERHDTALAFHRAWERAGTHVASVMHWIAPSRVMERNGRVFERSADERGPAGTPWFQHIERQHRNGMLKAAQLQTSDPNAIVLMSDVDEIPTPDAVERAVMSYGERVNPWVVMAQRFHSTALDLLHPVQPWWGTCVSPLAFVAPQAHRDARTTIGSTTDPQIVRVLERGGWHFSWFGDDATRARKLDTFSHAELRHTFDPAEGRKLMRHPNGEALIVLTVAESEALDWPAPLLDGSFAVPPFWLTQDARA